MAFIKIMSGAQAGTKYDIDKDETVIGRGAENTIVLNEPAVSHKHCAIIRDGRMFSVRDVGSTNGTRLNESKVTDNRLKPKDIVTIGDGPNDVLMFRKSGFSIAMGNASKEVKAQAQAVTDNNENEGFAKAMRKYFLRAAAA